jgi:LysR family hydrogen peroxide-inducible transcriptional activator
MEMNQLRYVAAAARAGNFSRAAEQCRVSQPSLSQQIQKLEDELGERLFDRMKRRTKLTSHGEAFLRRAVRILEEAELAIREATDAKSLLSGTLTLQDGRLEVRELFAEELLLALPPGHPLTRKRIVPAEALKGERLIVMREGHCLGDQVLGFCEHRDMKPTISFRSAQLETIQALVAAGLGLSLIPAMAARIKRPNALDYRSLKPRPERKILAVWPKQHPLGRAARAFLDLMSARLGE